MQLANDTLRHLRLPFANGSLHPAAENVPAEQMTLLNASRIFRRDAKCDPSVMVAIFPPALSGECNGECADLPRGLEGGIDVLAWAGS